MKNDAPLVKRVVPEKLGFGDKLRAELAAKSMTQSELATKLGAKRGTVNAWICNRSIPPLEQFVAVSRILGVPLSDLVDIPSVQEDMESELTPDVRLDDLISIYGNLNETGRESLYQTAVDKEMSGRYHIEDERDVG